MKTELDDSQSPLSRTVTQINDNKLSTVVFNDETATGVSSASYAHAKGIFAISESSQLGFYVSHSMPGYPAVKSNKIDISIPDNAEVYGQDVFCMSLDKSAIETLASKLIYAKLDFYSIFLENDNTVKSTFPSYYDLATNKFKKDTTNEFFTADITLKGSSQDIKIITKNHQLKTSDLIDSGVAPTIKCSILAETWGRPAQDSYCPKSVYFVENTESVKIGSVSWTNTQDHSKWLICNDPK